MPESAISTSTPAGMSAGVKGVLLVVGAYVATMGLVACTSLAIIIQMDTGNCSAVSRGQLALLGTMAAMFLASVAVVGVAAWRIVAGVAGRVAIVAVYGAVMLLSYVAIAFGFMVAFNC